MKYCELKGFRGFEDDYGLARFCQIVGNFFGGGLSLGVVTDVYPSDAEGIDNGIYSVKGWRIVNRYFKGREQRQYDLIEMLKAIDEAQPVKEQFGAEFFDAEPAAPETIKPGDTVYYIDQLDGRCYKHTCIGIGWDHCVNGRGVLGVPFIDRYGKDSCGYENNPNNYLYGKEYRVIRKG